MIPPHTIFVGLNHRPSGSESNENLPTGTDDWISLNFTNGRSVQCNLGIFNSQYKVYCCKSTVVSILKVNLVFVSHRMGTNEILTEIFLYFPLFYAARLHPSTF